jgi:hypothetical protein
MDYFGQAQRFYVNRTFGGNSYHCVVDGNIDAVASAGKETGKSGYVPVKPQAMGHYFRHVYRGQQRLFSQTHKRFRALDKCPVRLLLSGCQDTRLPDGDKN